MKQLGQRVSKLEAAAQVNGGVIVTRQQPGESEADAWARLWAEHPTMRDGPDVLAVLIRHFGQPEGMLQ